MLFQAAHDYNLTFQSLLELITCQMALLGFSFKSFFTLLLSRLPSVDFQPSMLFFISFSWFSLTFA